MSERKNLLRTQIGPLMLNACIFNACVPNAMMKDDLECIGLSESAAIMTKSVTLHEREGNPKPRSIPYINLGNHSCSGSFNSEGLPNPGIYYYICKETLEAISKFSKPYIISIAGKTIEEYCKMVATLIHVDRVDGIEINLACPNIPGSPVIGYMFEEVDRLLANVTSINGISSKAIGVKLPPYYDAVHCRRITNIIVQYKIDYIVTSNSIGNCLFIDPIHECSKICANDGFGGLAGGYIKPLALANVRNIYKTLVELSRTDIDIVGVGGVATGYDAFEMILCGASAVQVGTCFWNEGPICFKRIASELSSIMKARRYDSIDAFKGKLRPYSNSVTMLNEEDKRAVSFISMLWRIKDAVKLTWTLYVTSLLEWILLILTAVLNTYLGLIFVYLFGAVSVAFIFGLMLMSVSIPALMYEFAFTAH